MLFIKGPDDLSTTKERLLGFQSAMKQYGVPIDPDLILNGDFGFRSGYTAVMMLHRRRIPFTAIVASNDMMALGAIQALRELEYFRYRRRWRSSAAMIFPSALSFSRR